MAQTTMKDEARTRLAAKDRERQASRAQLMAAAKAERDEAMAVSLTGLTQEQRQAEADTKRAEAHGKAEHARWLTAAITLQREQLADMEAELAELQPHRPQPLNRFAKRQKTPGEAQGYGTPCVCGCGATPTKHTSRFIPGHDQRCKGWIVRARATDTVHELSDRVREYGEERGLL